MCRIEGSSAYGWCHEACEVECTWRWTLYLASFFLADQRPGLRPCSSMFLNGSSAGKLKRVKGFLEIGILLWEVSFVGGLVFV